MLVPKAATISSVLVQRSRVTNAVRRGASPFLSLFSHLTTLAFLSLFSRFDDSR